MQQSEKREDENSEFVSAVCWRTVSIFFTPSVCLSLCLSVCLCLCLCLCLSVCWHNASILLQSGQKEVQRLTMPVSTTEYSSHLSLSVSVSACPSVLYCDC